MDTQKGLAPILLILAGLIVVGGVVYFYMNSYQRNEEVDVENQIETSTSTSEQSESVSGENKINSVRALDYTGQYYLIAPFGEPHLGTIMYYTLDIFKEKDEYFGYLNQGGYESFQPNKLKVKLIQKDAKLSVVFDSYVDFYPESQIDNPEPVHDPYKKGDLLFTLDFINAEKLKIDWQLKTSQYSGPYSSPLSIRYVKDCNLTCSMGGGYLMENMKPHIDLNNSYFEKGTIENASGIITDLYTKGDKNYMDIDYIEINKDWKPGGGSGSAYSNTNSKIRTFEIYPYAFMRIGSFGESNHNVHIEELKNIYNKPEGYQKENPWDIVIINGMVVDIREHFLQ